MIKKVFAILFAINLATFQLVHAQNQSTTSGSASGASASSAAGAATAGVTTAVVGAAVAAIAVAAAISSSKADPVYTYSNTDQAWGTVTICIANC